MKPWQFALAALALLGTIGCRTDPAVRLLERELRLKEDEIYRLRAKVDDFESCDTSSQGWVERDAKRDEEPPAERDSAAPRRRRSAETSNGPNGAKPPMVELPSQSSSGVPDAILRPGGAAVPAVPDVPAFLKEPSKLPDSKGSQPDGFVPKPRPEPEGPALEGGSGAATSRPSNAMTASLAMTAAPFNPSGDSRRVDSIAIHRELTGGTGSDDRGGHQGLLVVLEPRDTQGRFVDAPADVSIAVLDPAVLDAKGRAKRIARWDFTAAETASMFRRAGSSQAIHLMTAWPGDPPPHHRLHLFVRYITADGRKLEANQPIEVQLPGDKTAQWSRPPEDRAVARRENAEVAPESPRRAEPPAPRANDAQSRRPVWSPERR